VTEAAQVAGFADAAHLSRTFKRRLGFPPSALRRMRVTNVVDAEPPGGTDAMFACAGKQDCGGQPAWLIGTQPMTKSCGLLPLFLSVSVTWPLFWALRMTGEKASSSTVTSNT